jgi:uncharacterized protein YdeI (YjbR/CyaY-like superfamily)
MEAEKPKKSWNRDDIWGEELALLKSILEKTELTETTKWGGPVYTVNGKNVLGIGGFKNYFTIWFFNGVFLSDPKNVLVNANEGVTKSLRQWRFATIAEVDEKTVLAYVNEAIANEKAGKNVPAEAKSKHFVIPEILKSALAENKLTANFEGFTPYKQYEFVEYIDAAKQDKTKLARIEKILPIIKDNIGLNDKYRS